VSPPAETLPTTVLGLSPVGETLPTTVLGLSPVGETLPQTFLGILSVYRLKFQTNAEGIVKLPGLVPGGDYLLRLTGPVGDEEYKGCNF